MGRLVHEGLERPIGPAWPDRAQPAGPEGAVGEIVRQRPDALRADIVPMVRARDREWIVGRLVQPFRHEARGHDLRRPAGGCVMLHRHDLAAVVERHAQRLDGRRAKRVEAHVVGTRQHHLHRLAEGLGRQRRWHGIVAVQPPAEAAAES